MYLDPELRFGVIVRRNSSRKGAVYADGFYTEAQVTDFISRVDRFGERMKFDVFPLDNVQNWYLLQITADFCSNRRYSDYATVREWAFYDRCHNFAYRVL